MHIFVYGTLMTSIPSSMSKFLRRKGQLVGKATVPGTLYDLGMYPGFIAGGESTVKGELYRLNPRYRRNDSQYVGRLRKRYRSTRG